MGYVLREGETEAPAWLLAALRQANRLQDIVLKHLDPGLTGNAAFARMRDEMSTANIDGRIYTHPIGDHGHGAGPLIGLWDYQEGVPGRGDAKVIPNMWFSSELQATTKVPEWGGQPVRIAQEEDFVLGANGKPRWALQRQSEFHLVRSGAM